MNKNKKSKKVPVISEQVRPERKDKKKNKNKK